MLDKEEFALIASRFKPGGPERMGQFLMNRLADRGYPYRDPEVFYCEDADKALKLFEERYTLVDMAFVKDWAVQCIEMESVSLVETLAKVHKIKFDFSFTTTTCHVMMNSGFIAVGTSGCADPNRFHPEVGKKLAWDDVVRQLMAHEAYILAEKLRSEGRVDLLSLPF